MRLGLGFEPLEEGFEELGHQLTSAYLEIIIGNLLDKYQLRSNNTIIRKL